MERTYRDPGRLFSAPGDEEKAYKRITRGPNKQEPDRNGRATRLYHREFSGSPTWARTTKRRIGPHRAPLRVTGQPPSSRERIDHVSGKRNPIIESKLLSLS